MNGSAADRNLLFGILALQLDFISRSALIDAMYTWVKDKSKPLGQILHEQGALGADEQALLEGLVQKHLQKHQGDADKSLAAISSVPSVRQQLQAIADPDLQASLAHVSQNELPDPNATRNPSVGTPTSSGTRFRILRPHARGGLGEVYVAHDEELHREVALKEIQDRHADDPDSRSRFLLEAEITGGLEHPGIVPVYGLGQYADGRPFYAMRFIKGDSLKEAIERFHKAEGPEREPGQRALELRQLLGRFIDVCNAMEYSHSRGVLHRDLKPGNIMLGKYGETLVVDWGLAKALDRQDASTIPMEEVPLQPASASSVGETAAGSAIGTPGFMSPEQAAGRLDLLGPASDVYSLGATLYCLLTGKAPFEGADIGSVLRKVQHGGFPRPRQVQAQVPAALEAICLKAMALQPQERYPSPKELAEELEHWLADEPVAAYPEPWTARAGRWMKRHRTGVTAGVAAAGVAALCLAAATVLLAAANQRERLATDEATRQRDEARRQKELAETAQQQEREAKEEATRQRDEVRKQKDRADQNLARARKAVEDYCTNVADDQRLKEADLHPLRKKLLQTAVPFYQEFVEQKRDDPQLQAEQGRAFGRLAFVQHEMGETTEAIADYRQMQAMFTGLARAHPAVPKYRQDLATSHNNLGVLLKTLGQPQEAEAEYRQALAVRQELAADFSTIPEYRLDLAASHNTLGNLLDDLGQRQEAEAEYHQALAVQEKLAADFPTIPEYRRELALSHNNLGNLLDDLGQHKEAEAQYRQALSVQEKLAADFPTVPEYHLELAGSHNNLGSLLRNLGQRQVAEVHYRRALAVREKLAADFPSVPEYRQDLAASHNNLGSLLRDLGHYKEAEVHFRQSLAVREKLAADFPTVPGYRKDLASSHTNLGVLLTDLGQHKEAEAQYRQALIVQEKLAADFPTVVSYGMDLGRSYYNLGYLLRQNGQPANALELFNKAASTVTGVLARDSGQVKALELLRSIRWQRAMALAATGKPAEAIAEATALAKDTMPLTFYNAACVFAVASAAAKDNARLAEQYATHALDLLVKVREAGFFKDPANVEYLKQDINLAPLRSRTAYKKFLKTLEDSR